MEHIALTKITDELIEGHKIIKIKIGEFEFMLIAENGSVFMIIPERVAEKVVET